MVMKLYLKVLPGIIGLACISRALLAADTPSAPTTYTTSTYAPSNYTASKPVAHSSSNGVIAALNAQALLLTEMTQEHQKRAADLTQTNQIEKAKWETDLVNELQEKSARLQKSIGQANAAWPGAKDLKAGAGEVDEQLAFVSTVESRLDQLQQELSAAVENNSLLSLQIVTNKPPDDMAAMISSLGESQRLVNQLQREQLDLELRKLEFRAILKAMQK